MNKMNGKVKQNKKMIFEKPVPEYRSFLLMLPDKIMVTELTRMISSLNPDTVEIWTELNLLELTLSGGTVTFEDFNDEMTEEDVQLLLKMKVKQVYACDYEASVSEEVKKIITELTEKTKGFCASDTEDFEPLLKIEDL